jgi:hypothetical protein
VFNAEGEVYGDDNSSAAELAFFPETPKYGNIKGNQAIAKNGVFEFG